jgi:hypothetical protein
MQERKELDWVGYVLQDVITFLIENEMIDSAQMLAVAATHVDHDLKGRKPLLSMASKTETKILAFPAGRRVRN